MKQIIILILALCAITNSWAQGESGTEQFNVDGVSVFLKHSSKEVFSAKWVVEGGTSNYNKANEGIEGLAFSIAAGGGTTKLPKQAYHSALNKTGTSVSGSTTYDYSNISLNCLVKYLDDSWMLFTDAILHPAFDSTEFANSKQKAIGAAKQAESDPDTYLRHLAMEHAWQGKDYWKIHQGSVASLETMTLEGVKAHYDKVNTKNQGFLVVVGNITKEELVVKVKATLSKLPQGNYSSKPPQALSVNSSAIIKSEREIATNYLRGMMGAPAANSKDESAMKVAASILRDRIYMEIRSKRNLSYAPGYYFPNLKNAYTFLYVTTDSPTTCAKVMLHEINNAKTSGFTEKELEDKKSSFLTRHYMRLETNASQAEMLTIAKLQGDWQKNTRFVDEVFGLTLADINNVIKKYLDGVKWAYIGDLNMLKEEVFQH